MIRVITSLLPRVKLLLCLIARINNKVKMMRSIAYFIIPDVNGIDQQIFVVSRIEI